MLNDDNNYKKSEKKMRDLRLEYEARMKKKQEEREKAVSLFIEFGSMIEKGREIKKPKNQIWGKGFGKNVWKQSGSKGRITIQKDRSEILRVAVKGEII